MKKGLCSAVLLMSVVFFAFAATSVSANHKDINLVSTGDGDTIIETGELIVMHVQIIVGNYGDQSLPLETWNNVVVKDHFGAEWELASSLTASQGSASYSTHGGSDQLRIKWNVGTVEPYTTKTLDFDIRTDHNPAGKQEFTTPGTYAINSGPNLKCKIDGVQYSLDMNQVYITVFPPD
jgi:hypothetical protein